MPVLPAEMTPGKACQLKLFLILHEAAETCFNLTGIAAMHEQLAATEAASITVRHIEYVLLILHYCVTRGEALLACLFSCYLENVAHSCTDASGQPWTHQHDTSGCTA